MAGGADNKVAAIVRHWQQLMHAGMAAVIGFNATKVPRRDVLLEQAFVDSWLHSDTTADVAISNGGGIRAALPAGTITVGTIVGILPFDNTIIATNLTGASLRAVLAQGASPLVAGLVCAGDEWIETASGDALADEKVYRVLVNSSMYAGGDNYQGIAAADPDGFDTGINYRQPFLEWVAAQQSSPSALLQLQTGN